MKAIKSHTDIVRDVSWSPSRPEILTSSVSAHSTYFLSFPYPASSLISSNFSVYNFVPFASRYRACAHISCILFFFHVASHLKNFIELIDFKVCLQNENFFLIKYFVLNRPKICVGRSKSRWPIKIRVKLSDTRKNSQGNT